MFTIVLENFSLLLLLSIAFCEDIKISSPIFGISSKTPGVLIAPTAFTGNKTAEFVNYIKDDLRKNNDDYVEPVQINISNPYLGINKQPITKTIAKTDTTKIYAILDKTDKKENLPLKNDLAFDLKRKLFKSIDVRRSGLVLPVKQIKIRTMSTSSKNEILMQHKDKITVPQRNWYSVEKTTPIKAPIKGIQDKNTKREEYPKYVNKEKVDKFAKYEAHKTARDIMFKKPIVRGNLQMYSSREEELVEKKAREATKTPGDELDMAPGRGGRMNAKRMKNYLCFRNVMIPEGPKYDSHGKIYLPAYTKIHSRDYKETTPPIFLLPKCCNCCKKSVLGCE